MTPPPPLQAPSFNYGPQGHAGQPPSHGGVPHAQTLLGLGSGLPIGRPLSSTFQQPAAPALMARPQPQMMDFSGSATLPEKSSGPPTWVAVVAIVVSLAGGAVLAQRATRGQMLALAAFDDARPARPSPPKDEAKGLPPRATEPSAAPPPAEAPAPDEEPAPAAAAAAPAPAAKPAHPRGHGKRHAAPGHRKPGRH